MDYRRSRKKLVDRCRKIIEENDVRTQQEFAEYYYKECKKELSERKDKTKDTNVPGSWTIKPSQTTIHRWFKYANIHLNAMTGFYICSSRKTYEERARESLEFILKEHAEKYKINEFNNLTVYVDSGCEQHVARSIQDYMNRKFCDIFFLLDKLIIKCNEEDIEYLRNPFFEVYGY